MALVELGYSGWKSYLIKFDIMELNSSTHEKPTNAKDFEIQNLPLRFEQMPKITFLILFLVNNLLVGRWEI